MRHAVESEFSKSERAELNRVIDQLVVVALDGRAVKTPMRKALAVPQNTMSSHLSILSRAGRWAAQPRPMLNSGAVRYEVGANIDRGALQMRGDGGFVIA